MHKQTRGVTIGIGNGKTAVLFIQRQTCFGRIRANVTRVIVMRGSSSAFGDMDERNTGLSVDGRARGGVAEANRHMPMLMLPNARVSDGI